VNSVILTTGGTGGHIFPALAVAEEIRRRHPACAILFMGGKYGPEADLAVQAGLEYVGLPVRGFLGRGVRAFGAAFGMLRGLAKARIVMSRVRPEVVAGFGGYAAFAGVAAARFKGIPCAIHEQNSVPGLANRVLGKGVNRVLLSLPDDRAMFPRDKALFTGNPVRAAVAALYDRQPRNLEDAGRRLLVMGGSQGARAINNAVLANLPALMDAGIAIWHQTGRAEAAAVREAYRAAGARDVRVDAFIHDMAAAYAWADLVLCRAGATSIAELTAAGLPAVFVPFPQATHDHQTHNARQLVRAGAAELVPQKDLAPDAGDPALLAGTLIRLFGDPIGLLDMGAAARNLARPDAAARVVNALEALAAGGRAQKGTTP
jgi:UDP-N-acetylglucosamine--N-acetylmuramyl-(pentapeptide) pyrophosphoryl-undecaprenol N-acetylglucosamine transferase